MLKIEARNVVYSIVQQELVHKGRDNEALYINLDLRMSYHVGGDAFDQSRGLHLLYSCPTGMSYITVFSGITDSPFAKIGEVKAWKHETTHDSCWRDINTFSQVYFDMARGINVSLSEEGREAIAPIDMYEGSSFRGNLYQWVPIKVTKDSSDRNNYRRMVELLPIA